MDSSGYPTDRGSSDLAGAEGHAGSSSAGGARDAPEAAPDAVVISHPSGQGEGSGAAEVVLLDAKGVILRVNQTWRTTVATYDVALQNAGIGSRYVDVARLFLPDLDEAVIQRSLSRLATGETDLIRHTYAINSPRGALWRQLQITRLSRGAGAFVAIHEDLTDLVQAQEALRLTSEQLLAARDEERQRIAVELHDSTSQHLAAISLGLAKLRKADREQRLAGFIDEISLALDETVKETRTLSYLMRPTGVVGAGLAANARVFVTGFGRRTGLEATIQASADADRASASAQHAALRIIQEALSNAYRHASAQHVTVEIRTDARDLIVSIADDGCGMGSSLDNPLPGVGIPGMRARAEQNSGRLEISSGERGTLVRARLPLS